MNELKKYKFWLIVITYLLCLKLIILPIISWQDTLVVTNQSLDRKNKKSQALIEQKENLELMLAEQKKEISIARSYFREVKSTSDFQLSEQKLIEEQLKRFELDSVSIGWASTEKTSELITELELNLSIKGGGYDVLRFLIEITTENKINRVSQMNLTFSYQSPGNLGQINVMLRKKYLTLNLGVLDV